MTFRHRRRVLHGTRVSHGRSNICSSVIAPLFLTFRLFASSSSSVTSVTLYCLWTTRGHRYTYVRTSRAWNYLLRPDFLLRILRCTPNGISFSFALASKRFTRRNSSHRENGTERRNSHRAAQFRTGQSTSEFTVVFILPSRCRVLPFHVAFLWMRKQHSSIALTPVIRVSLRLGALPLKSARLFPQASLFDCSHVR